MTDAYTKSIEAGYGTLPSFSDDELRAEVIRRWQMAVNFTATPFADEALLQHLAQRPDLVFSAWRAYRDSFGGDCSAKPKVLK